jgi:sirohydrochlorin cobaltochelatase
MLGVIVFAHGSRDPRWRLPVEAIAREIERQDPGVLIQCAYLEFCEPDLPTACEALIAAGAQRLRVLPLFVGMGTHAREHLPELVRGVAQRHPTVPIEQRPAVGEDPRLTTLLARIALETTP